MIEGKVSKFCFEQGKIFSIAELWSKFLRQFRIKFTDFIQLMEF